MVLTHINLKYASLIHSKIHQKVPNGKGLRGGAYSSVLCNSSVYASRSLRHQYKAMDTAAMYTLALSTRMYETSTNGVTTVCDRVRPSVWIH